MYPPTAPVHALVPVGPASLAELETLTLMPEQALTLMEQQISADAESPGAAGERQELGGQQQFKGGGVQVSVPSGVSGFRSFKEDPEAWLNSAQQKGETIIAAETVDIEAVLSSGIMTEREALVHLHNENRQLHARLDLEVATRRELAEGLGYVRRELAEAGEPAFRQWAAHLTAAPTNLHQAVVFWLTSDDAEDATMRKRAPLLYAMSLALVLAQTATAIGVLWGVYSPSCESSDQCHEGMFCLTNFDDFNEDGLITPDEIGSKRCEFCGQSTSVENAGEIDTAGPVGPMKVGEDCTWTDCYDKTWSRGEHPTRDGESCGGDWPTNEDAACDTYNAPDDPNFAGFNTTAVAMICADPSLAWDANNPSALSPWTPTNVNSWCETCVQTTGSVDPLTQIRLMSDNVAAMGFFDWVVLSFATLMVALAMIGELKDIELVAMAVRQADDRLSCGSRLALTFLSGIRRWMFLPTMLMIVPGLVLLQGGDALSVCFNTVAVLFMTEVDNIIFQVALPEQVRARVEEAGRVELGKVEQAALAWTKPTHICLIMAAVLGGVALGTQGAIFPPLVFWVGRMLQACSRGPTVRVAACERPCARMCKTTGACCCGLLGIGILAGAAYVV